MDNIYTVKEVANLLEVAPSTIRTWIHKDKLFAVRLGNKFAISETTLINFAFPKPKYAAMLRAKNERFVLMYGIWRITYETALYVKRNPRLFKTIEDFRIRRLKEKLEED
jgi:excisionase family DNA binding protein